MTDFKNRLDALLENITLDHSFKILLVEDILFKNEEGKGRFFIQLEKVGTDAITGEPWEGRGERLFLTPLMTDSEIVNSIFDLYRLFHEHEARETFKWRKRRIYSPHRSMEGLWTDANKLDLRADEKNTEPN